jgi:membrane-associated phospholipid phosphatase
LNGDLPGVQVVHEGLPALKGIYSTLNPNPVAAMPSLHSAYAWLFMLFAFRLWGARAAPVVLYPAGMYFSVLYLGHHYFVDVLAGILYATVAYVIVCSPAARRVAQAVRSLPSRLRGARAMEGAVEGADAPAAMAPAENPAVDA